MKQRLVLGAAGLAAAAAPAMAGGGVTLPDFGVDGPSIVTSLTSTVGPGVTAAVGLGMGLFAIGLVLRKIMQYSRG